MDSWTRLEGSLFGEGGRKDVKVKERKDDRAIWELSVTLGHHQHILNDRAFAHRNLNERRHKR